MTVMQIFWKYIRDILVLGIATQYDVATVLLCCSLVGLIIKVKASEGCHIYKFLSRSQNTFGKFLDFCTSYNIEWIFRGFVFKWHFIHKRLICKSTLTWKLCVHLSITLRIEISIRFFFTFSQLYNFSFDSRKFKTGFFTDMTIIGTINITEYYWV